MKIIGLTGSIASGKTTIGRMFSDYGIPVFCSDKAVHDLLKPKGKAFNAVAKKFPESVANGRIDRKKLGQIVFSDAEKLKILEKIIHPLVHEKQKKFITECRHHRKKIAVLDIPLLFETGADERVDVTMLVWAPALVQKQRALKRVGMTEEKFNAIINRQMPVAEKKKLADIVIASGLGFYESRKKVRQIIEALCVR